jgi:hypothetical protein
MRVWLHRVLDVSVLLAVGALGAALAVRFAPGPSRPAPQAATALRIGDRIARLKGLEPDKAERTVLLVLSSRCGVCTDSMPYYRSLAARLPRPTIRLVAAGWQHEDELAGYLRENGLKPDGVVRADAQSLPIAVTPAIVVLDRDGIVRELVLGRLSSADGEDLLRRIGTFDAFHDKKKGV